MDPQAQLMEKIETLTRLVGDLDRGIVVSEKLAQVTASQLCYLKAVDDLRYPTFGELAQRLGYAKPTVTNGVNKLIHRGLLRKIQSLDDKRVYHIELTKKGKVLIEAYKEVYRDYARHLVGVLNQQEIETLINLFTKIIEANDLSPK